MERWLAIAPCSSLPEGARLDVDLEGTPITVVRLASKLLAFEDRCSHDGEPLAGAEIELPAQDQPSPDGCAPSPVVICPRHGARFCLRDGTPLCPPAYEPIRVFAVRELGELLEVRVD